MLRLHVTQRGEPPLPAIDLAGRIVIGSGPDAQLHLPASDARPEHVVVEASATGGTWTARGPITVDGTRRESGTMGALAFPHGTTLEIGRYEVTITPAPAGAAPTPPQRTESIAREMMRALLGGDSAPSLTIERGPGAGAKRPLPPPEGKLVIGRGDEADWVIADADLSRAHAELRRTWDGISVVDLGSKNGTRVNASKLGATPRTLHHDDLIDLGAVALRFTDPAEKHLRGGAPPAVPEPAPPAGSAAGVLVFLVAVGVVFVTLAMLIWIVVI